MNEKKFYLINTCPRYGEHLLRTFKNKKDVNSFLLNTETPNRYKLVYGEELKFTKSTTMLFTLSVEELEGYSI
jgi:hypothetical protein